MRIDKLIPKQLALSERQKFFLSAWFNLSHRGSLDSYRVRVMNPINILRELIAMYQPHADESDRRRVAEEVVDIFSNQPVIDANREKYHGLDDFLTIINEALESSKTAGDKAKPTHVLSQRGAMIKSFCLQAKHSLEVNLLVDSMQWLRDQLTTSDVGLGNAEKRKSYYAIERAARDALSIALDEGGSIETLFQHYRAMVAPLAEGEAFDFDARLARVSEHLTADPKPHKIIFQIIGAVKPQRLEGTFGSISLTVTPPINGDDLPEAVKKFVATPNVIFACAEVTSRDGRSAGMVAFRQIGEILDLVRFAFDEKKIILKPRFLLSDTEKSLILEVPDIIPNPESSLTSQRLEEFVNDLNKWGQRTEGSVEGKDRVFSAFRLYRVGAEAKIFENKLVNWWTGVEYLTRGGKSSGGPIGAGVENALTYILLLGYMPKHLQAFHSTFKFLNIEAQLPIGVTKLGELNLKELYAVLKSSDNYPSLEAACSQHTYLWMHLQKFIEHLATPKKIHAFISVHEKRLRWQIQRIYRARCDIVHSGRQVVNASLLCANLEYYLKTVLRAMIDQLSVLPTVTGPGEFFDRSAFQYMRLSKQLSTTKTNEDQLLIQTLM